MKILMLCAVLSSVVACGIEGPVPEGTYEGFVASDFACPFDVDYRITLFYDGTFLEGSQREALASEGNSFTVNVTLKGRTALTASLS